MDEKDYRVDTTVVANGGQRRPWIVEPNAIANVNRPLITLTPTRVNPGFSREPQTVPNNYMSRRDSSIWTRSPSEDEEEKEVKEDDEEDEEKDDEKNEEKDEEDDDKDEEKEDDDDEDAPSEPSEMDWEATDALILTPLPQTPAPETVARFALDVTPGTPTNQSSDSSADNNQPLPHLQTCPPRTSGLINLGERLVNRTQEQTFEMRLMAARRKSMQYAPKVASPLKNQWKKLD